MIEARGLTKRYGDTVAVDGLTFDIRPGVVTGFLGPNGAGKSTTMRMILGLDHPTAGSVDVGGRRYRDLAAPMREVGALLDAGAVHGKRTARAHLRWLADAGGLPRTPRRGGARPGRAHRRRRPPRRRLLARHVAAARHRHGAARRPRHAAVRRADERARPRGHPLDPHAAAALRRRGPHGRRLQPPHARDGGDRRPRARDRARAADRRHQHLRASRCARRATTSTSPRPTPRRSASCSSAPAARSAPAPTAR